MRVRRGRTSSGGGPARENHASEVHPTESDVRPSPPRKIKITCEVKDLVDPEKLTPFQGQLKTLYEEEYEKLKESLLRHGWAFPVYVWKSGGKLHVIDAHQRLTALEIMKEDGITIEGGKVPVVFVAAKNLKAAKELVLAALSQYGKYENDSVHEFIKTSDLEWAEVKKFAELPALNMGTLEKGWFDPDYVPEERAGGSGGGGGGSEGKTVTCPYCKRVFTR